MFKSLREKIGGWFGKKEPEKEISKENSEKPTKKTGAKKGKEILAEKVKKRNETTKEKESKKVSKKTIKKKTLEEELQKTAENISEEVPVIFKAGTQKFEPDIDKLKEELGEKVTEDEIKETPKEYLADEVDKKEEGGFFARLRKKISSAVLTREDFEEEFMELELALLENNVALEVVDKIKESLMKTLVGISVKKGEEENVIIEGLKGAISEVLVEPKDVIGEIRKSLDVYVILFFGINGVGKTTTIAKFASMLKREKISCVLAAGDTFRAASIEQLEQHANKLNVPIVKSTYGSDPASVGFDAVQYAKKNKIKVVLLDTAGRMYTKNDLMKEMEKIVRVAKPNLKVFVGESIAGNDVVEQARMFNETAGIDGTILSKADIDEKSGAVLSVGFVTGKPILFLGMGQKYEDLKKFSKTDVLKGLGLE